MSQKEEESGLTLGHDFVVTRPKESLLEIKNQLNSVYLIKTSIIGGGSEKKASKR